MKEMGLYPEIKRAFEKIDRVAVAKIPGSTYNQGLPDYIATYMGRAVHCEVKIATAKRVGVLSELQRAHLERHNAAGAICFTLTYNESEKRWVAVTVGSNPTTYSAQRPQLSDLLESVMNDHPI